MPELESKREEQRESEGNTEKARQKRVKSIQ